MKRASMMMSVFLDHFNYDVITKHIYAVMTFVSHYMCG